MKIYKKSNGFTLFCVFLSLIGIFSLIATGGSQSRADDASFISVSFSGGDLVVSAALNGYEIISIDVANPQDEIEHLESAESEVAFVPTGGDGLYRYDVQVVDSEGKIVDRTAGQFKVENGLIVVPENEEDKISLNLLKGAGGLFAWVLNQAFDMLSTDVYAADVTVSNPVASLYFDDTDNSPTWGANDWEIRGGGASNSSSGFLYIYNLKEGVGAYQLKLNDAGANGLNSFEIDGSGDLHFANDGMFFDRSSKRLGVGTTAPAYMLDVVGSSRIRLRDSTAGTAKTIMMRADGAAVDLHSLNADLFLRSEGNDIVMNSFAADGNVGIGRLPAAKLHVAGDAGTIPAVSAHTQQIISNSSAGSDRAYLSIIAGSTTGISRINFGDTAQENVGFFSYSHSNNSMQVFAGNSEVMRFVNNKMGIGGEVSPDSTLSIKGNAAIGAGYSGSAAGPANGMIVEGNVGIGTTSPNGKLDVNGSIYQRGGVLHADYVFEPDYQLDSIEKHAEFMWQNKHLKAMPKATVDENGNEIVEVGAHRKGIVEELEIAHIYIEQLQNQIRALEERLSRLEN